MKNFKKVLSGFVALTMAISTNTISANATCSQKSKLLSINAEFNPGVYETSEEQYERFITSDYATPERITRYKTMMEEHEKILSGDTISPRASVRRLGVPFYEQENNYYCGPATVRQICGYLNGTSGLPTQTQIANTLGTTSYYGTEQQAIIDYLNSNCSVEYETLWRYGAYTSPSALFNCVIADASQYKPTVAHITDATTSNWRYSTSGHYLCFEGYVDDTTTNGHIIYVVDPWLDGHNISNGKYSVLMEQAYAVTDRIGS